MKKTLIQIDQANSPLRALFAADTDSANSAKVLVEESNKIVTSINSMLDYVDEPLKGVFLQVKGQINKALAGMEPTDQAPAALQSSGILRELLCVLSCASSMISHLGDTAKSARSEAATTRASMSGEVEKAIKAKIDGGELVSKADVQGQIDNAVKQAREAAEQARKLVSDRRTALASASLPVPDDARLTVEETEYSKLQERAKTRAEKLKPFKVAPERLVTLCWGMENDVFDTTLALLSENQPAQKGNPFLPGSGNPAKSPAPLAVLC